MNNAKNGTRGQVLSNITAWAIVGVLCPLLLNTGCGEIAQDEKTQTKSAMCSSDVTCDGDRVRYAGVNLPRIGFDVDGQRTCCMKSAQRMAKGDPSKIAYVVAGKKCKNLEEAQAARLKVLDEYYADVLTIKYAVGDDVGACLETAKDKAKASGKPLRYRLAAFDFGNKNDADKAAAAARAAADKVTVLCAVGDKTFACPKEAAEFAKSSGKKVEYRVGEQATTCKNIAKTRLIEARITAAFEVLMKAAEG